MSLVLSLALPARAAEPQQIGKPQPFDYAALKGMARALAGTPYKPEKHNLPAALSHLSWDQYQAIRFKPAHALWRGDHLNFQIQFFHLGLYYKEPVRMYLVEDGRAREIAYDPAMFDYGDSGVHGRRLPRDLGFAGFRVQIPPDWKTDVTVFLGASYFRAVGGSHQYGLSARGLAIDTGLDRPEEFPSFKSFWLERPKPGSRTLTVYALLDSPSTTGAYRFDITPGDMQVMEVDAALYPRRPIERLGIAPLTSMFLCGENQKFACDDFRPEIHDSDGLSLWTGAGEWIWRPLNNSSAVRVNSFYDDNPRGFGLLQRDRNFDHYQDDGVFYERRPSVWVEPKGSWGKGAVQLVELHTDDETRDNIVAFWNPDKKPEPGEEFLMSYRLFWGAEPPATAPLARIVATRTGAGGVVGQKRSHYSRRFVIDFAGGELAKLPEGAKIVPVIVASRGRIEIPSARPLHEIHGYRAIFDLAPTDDSAEPIDLRLYLKSGDKPLTETWLYQWTPPPPVERKF